MEEFFLTGIRSLSNAIDMIATVVIPFEFVLLAARKKSFFPGDAHVNLVCGACIFLLFKFVDGGLPSQFLYKLEALTIFDIEMTPWVMIVYVLLGDLCFYAWHRLAHTSILFKLDHSLHHSSSELNYTTNLRVSVFAWCYSWLPILIPVSLGFNPAILLACFYLSNAVPFFLHNERTPKLGWLEYIFNTPSHHRVHHGQNTCYINKNFGGMLILWDRLFGTYAEELEPVVFGVANMKATRNPFRAIFSEWLLLYKEFVFKYKRRTERLAVLNRV